MQEVMHKSFYQPLISIISDLCRRTTLIKDIRSIYCTVRGTSRLSLKAATSFIVLHCVQLTVYFDKKPNAPVLDNKFCILVDAVKAFMKAVDLCFRVVLERSTIIAKHSPRLKLILNAYRTDIYIDGPLFGTDILMVADQGDIVSSITTLSGTFAAREQLIRTFVENRSYASEEALGTLEPDIRYEYFNFIASLYLHASFKY